MYYLMKLSLILSRLLWGYSILIWIRIMMSWIIPYPSYGGFAYYIGKLVDPYLNTFRKTKLTAGRLDFSPIIAIGVISVFQSILSYFGSTGHLSLGLIIFYFIQGFWSYGVSFFFMFAIILLVIQTIASFSKNPAFYTMGAQLGSPVSGLTNFVKKLFFKNRIAKDRTVNLITLGFVVVFYFITKYVFEYLAILAMRIPV